MRTLSAIVFLMLASCLAFGQVAIQAPEFDLGSAWTNGIRTNSNPTDIYANSPSVWIGNLFNQTIGKTNPNVNFDIEEARTFPSFSGAQLWIRVTSDDMGRCHSNAETECWVLLGIIREPLDLEVTEFSIQQKEHW